MAISTTRATLTLPTDVGLDAAGVFDRFLASFTRDGAPESPDRSTWQALEAGGWLDAGRGGDGAGLDLIDLAELAAAWGRYLIPAPFITTLLARRHMGAESWSSDFGFTYALVAGPGALVPHGALEGCTYLTALGVGAARAGALEATDVDDFAPTLPLVAATAGSTVDDEVVRETVVLLAAELIGLSEAILKRTLDFANVRTVYGQELAKFQVIRFRMADVLGDIEAQRGLMLSAVNEEIDIAAPSARLVARSARRVVEACLQTHGAMGFTWELGIHRLLRHAIAAERLLDQVVRGRAGAAG